MKKVGIMTYHNSHSYGASLQAYATLKALCDLGYDAYLVDYRNKYEQQRFKPHGKGLKNKLKDIKTKTAYYLLGSSKNYNRAFGNRNEMYQDRISSDGIWDTLITGSDQTWNLDITGGLDPMYFLRFGDANRRISYAASMGSRKFTDEESEKIKEYLKDYDAIAVREQFAKDEISKLTDTPIKIVCDPTLLITDWSDITADISRYSHGKKFALAMFIGGCTERNIAFVKKARKMIDVPILDIHNSNSFPRDGFDKCISGVTVPEFVSLIRESEYVITDSFHGVAMSILLGKKVLPLINAKNPERVTYLLKSIGLEDMIENTEVLKENVDYSEAYKKIESIRQDSLDWLKGNV